MAHFKILCLRDNSVLVSILPGSKISPFKKLPLLEFVKFLSARKLQIQHCNKNSKFMQMLETDNQCFHTAAITVHFQ